MFEYKKLKYSRESRIFTYDRYRFYLTIQKERLMLLFMRRAEEVLTYEKLKFEIWGDYPFTNKSRNVRSNIQLLRADLPGNLSDWIKNVRGVGYILMDD